MTPEEAIELLKGMQSPLEDYAELVGAPAFAYGYKYVYPDPEDYAIEEAIEALKEIQQYREIGTVEQVRNQKHNLEMAYKIISDYEAIGTVEECREAVEKQKPKKVIDRDLDFGYYTCPSCGTTISFMEDGYKSHKFCLNCGQAILQEDEDD